MKSSVLKNLNLKLDANSTKNLYRFFKESLSHYSENDFRDYVVDARKLTNTLEKIIEEYNVE